MYLLKVLNGKENLIATILKKYNIPSKRGAEKGLLFTDIKVPVNIMYELRDYIIGIAEVEDHKAQTLIDPPKKPIETIKSGNLVEITSGPYQGFRGIVREVKQDSVIIDIFLFGQTCSAEASLDQIEPYKIDMLPE